VGRVRSGRALHDARRAERRASRIDAPIDVDLAVRPMWRSPDSVMRYMQAGLDSRPDGRGCAMHGPRPTAPCSTRSTSEGRAPGFAGLGPAWVPFGAPRPVIVRDALLGTAFTHDGDGSFWSGAWSARELDRHGGRRLEATLSVPVATLGASQEQPDAQFRVSRAA
jgi:hypothetical protein